MVDRPAPVGAVGEIVDPLAEDHLASVADRLGQHGVVLGVEVARREDRLARARFLEGGQVHLAAHRPGDMRGLGREPDLFVQRQLLWMHDLESSRLQQILDLGLVCQRALGDAGARQVDLACWRGGRDRVRDALPDCALPGRNPAVRADRRVGNPQSLHRDPARGRVDDAVEVNARQFEEPRLIASQIRLEHHQRHVAEAFGVLYQRPATRQSFQQRVSEMRLQAAQKVMIAGQGLRARAALQPPAAILERGDQVAR